MTGTIIAGAGAIAVEHFKALSALGETPVVLGRGEASARAFEAATGAAAGTGDFAGQLQRLDAVPRRAVVAVSLPSLADVTRTLLDAGVDRILLEKPGGVTLEEVRALAGAPGAERVCMAYNRRFLRSAITARRRVAEEGGATSLHFEFNENIPAVAGLEQHSDHVKRNWFLANSTHVTDMAFHLAGASPRLDEVTLDAATLAGDLQAVPPAVSMAGSGRVGEAVFSYLADWRSAGRWGIEIATRAHRYVLKPIESLKAIPRGSFAMHDVPLDAQEPEGVKPGFFNMHQAFLEDPDGRELLSLPDQADRLALMARFAGLQV